MVYTLSYQMYKCEHGLGADEQRAADVRAGLRGAAAAWGAAGSAARRARSARRPSVRPARRAAGPVTGSGAASMRLLSNGR